MARIIGVADTFDAITTNRPYQTASSPEFALKTIKKLTGTRFDAKIVTAFLLAWDGGHIKFWSRNTLHQLLSEAGFERIDSMRVGRIPPLAKSIIALARKPAGTTV